MLRDNIRSSHSPSRVSDPTIRVKMGAVPLQLSRKGYLYVYSQRCSCEADLRQTVYIFVGTILLHNHTILIVAGSIVGIVGIGYCVLQFLPNIEPPQNMRDAGAEWGAEQI